jgi:autotransporter-associated beta strand protein
VLVRYHGSFWVNGYATAINELTLEGGGASTGPGILTVTGLVASIGDQIATITGNLDLAAGQRVIDVADGAASDDLMISAVVTNGGITKLGAGRLLLSGANNYEGSTVVSNGVLAVGSPKALGGVTQGTDVRDGAGH